MLPQHLGGQCSSCGQNDTAATQNRRLNLDPYLMPAVSIMVGSGITQASLTSEPGRVGHFAVQRLNFKNRRDRCPRASNSLQRSALSPQSRHVPVARQTKNTLWLSQSPSRLSQHTQANTSKPDTGQAVAPVLTSLRGRAGYAFEMGGLKTSAPKINALKMEGI